MTPTQKRSFAIDWSPDDLDRGGHEHFMRKEILEQPQAIERALRGRLDDRFATAHLGGVQLDARAGARASGACGCSAAAPRTTPASPARS